jgi:LmbE family N-acetylglucosaminyl deacetylase
MVFAPHQDDETLGCGGTVILKRRAGATVTLVFMTDGSTSHREYMKEERLRSLRRDEALNAAMFLGLAPEDVHFLDFPDGMLERFHADAVDKVVDILDRYRPAEVFVPYRFDGTPDHESTHAVVVAAVRKAGRSAEVCEYPIWFWNRWPWVPLELRCDRETVKSLVRILKDGFGRRHFHEFKSGVYVQDVLARKMEALSHHRSQMNVLIPGTAWPTLADISAGEFLRCFFQEFEVFRCWSIP